VDSTNKKGAAAELLSQIKTKRKKEILNWDIEGERQHTPT
jgi:hypothetical protein